MTSTGDMLHSGSEPVEIFCILLDIFAVTPHPRY
jgi:hypothetical protein